MSLDLTSQTKRLDQCGSLIARDFARDKTLAIQDIKVVVVICPHRDLNVFVFVAAAGDSVGSGV